jgi:hypothetical protein
MMYGIDYQYQIGLCVLNLFQCPYPYGYMVIDYMLFLCDEKIMVRKLYYFKKCSIICAISAYFASIKV